MLFRGKPSQEIPFKYLKLARAFEEEDYDILDANFPNPDDISSGVMKTSNGGNRFDVDLEIMHDIVQNPEVYRIIENHTSLSFFHSLCDLFEVETRNFRSISSRYDSVHTDVTVDFQFSLNEKNSFARKSYLRAPHLDAEDKLFVILIYFPMKNVLYEEKDLGNLRLYKTRDSRTVFRNDRIVSLSEIDHIPYAPNHGIVFMNGPDAIHAPECLLNHPMENRRFVNIIFMTSKPPV